MKVEFTIPGEPFGKQRPQFSTFNGHVTARTPKKTVVYENLVKMEYQNQCKEQRFGDNAMLRVDIFAYFSIPKSASAKNRTRMKIGYIRPTKRPDVDNICKTILDSLNKIAYRDDAQVTAVSVYKFYAYEDNPRVVVTIEEIPAVEGV